MIYIYCQDQMLIVNFKDSRSVKTANMHSLNCNEMTVQFAWELILIKYLEK